MRILLCDDHAVVRDGLRLVLEALGPEVVLLDAGSLGAALETVQTHPDLDLILLDLHMPGVDGLDGLRRLRKEHPTIAVAVVSAEEDARTMRAALELGASGYIPKSAGREELLAAVRLVLSGGLFVPRAAIGVPAEEAIQAEQAQRRERAARLTVRQLEVLSLMARGLTNREICGVLGIAENTVKSHVKAILEALDATNRTEAAVLARELDLRAPGEA